LLNLLAAFLIMGPMASVAMAHGDEDHTPGEELVEDTAEMVEEATEEFNDNIDCADAASNGEELPEDCVVEQEDVSDETFTEEEVNY
jgi:hypothetical protein